MRSNIHILADNHTHFCKCLANSDLFRMPHELYNSAVRKLRYYPNPIVWLPIGWESYITPEAKQLLAEAKSVKIITMPGAKSWS